MKCRAAGAKSKKNFQFIKNFGIDMLFKVNVDIMREK